MTDIEVITVLGQLVDEASWKGKDLRMVVDIKSWLGQQRRDYEGGDTVVPILEDVVTDG